MTPDKTISDLLEMKHPLSQLAVKSIKVHPQRNFSLQLYSNGMTLPPIHSSTIQLPLFWGSQLHKNGEG